MDKISLSKLQEDLNLQIIYARSQVQLAARTNLKDFSIDVLVGYLWGVDCVLEKAERLLNRVWDKTDNLNLEIDD
jgi:hypothetical protein